MSKVDFSFMDQPKPVKLPWWAKVLGGGAIVGVIWWKLPIVELMALFLYVVLIPITLIASLFGIGEGVVEGLGSTWDVARTRINKHRSEMKEKEQAGAAA